MNLKCFNLVPREERVLGGDICFWISCQRSCHLDINSRARSKTDNVPFRELLATSRSVNF